MPNVTHLTTARASNDAVGLNTALTAGPLAWTVNSSGISLNAASAAGTTSGFGGNLISGSITHNTAGLNLSLNHPAWLTTAMQSNAATISNINISAGTTSTNASAFTFNNSNGITFGLGTGASAGSVTASHNGLTSQSNQAFSASGGSSAFQTLNFANSNGITFSNSNGSVIASHNGLTTARASNDAVGLNTAQSNVTWTVNSSGISLDARGYVGTATGFTGTNVSATMTHNSAGFSLQLSAGGGGITPAVSGSNGSFSFSTLSFGNLNGLSFYTSNGSIVGSYTDAGAGGGVNFSAGTTSNNLNAITFSNANGVSFGLNGSTITASVPVNATLASYFEGAGAMTLLSAPGNASVSVERFLAPDDITATQIAFPVYQSISSSAVANTYGQQWTISAMVFTNDTANSRLMSLSSGSTQTTYTLASNNSGATQLIGSGVRPVTCPININMTPGVYYMAYLWSTNNFSSGTATTALNRTVSMIGRAPIMSASFAMVSAYDVATAATNNVFFPQGVLSGGATAAIPNTISHSQMTMTGASHSQANLAFYLRA